MLQFLALDNSLHSLQTTPHLWSPYSSGATMRAGCYRGFTLIELLVAIAIIGILIALLLPAVQMSRETARRIRCQNHLKQLALGLHNYHDSHDVLPSGSIIQGPGIESLSGWGWGAMILPYLDQASLYQQIDFDRGTAVAANGLTIQNLVPIWYCPTDIGPQQVVLDLTDPNMVNLGSTIPPGGGTGFGLVTVAAGNYLGSEGMLYALSSLTLTDVRDGLSQTLMLGERIHVPASVGFSNESFSSWCGFLASEYAFAFNAVPYTSVSRFSNGFSSRHPGGMSFALGDGSVRLISKDIDRGVLEALATPQGDDVVAF